MVHETFGICYLAVSHAFANLPLSRFAPAVMLQAGTE